MEKLGMTDEFHGDEHLLWDVEIMDDEYYDENIWDGE